MAKKKRAQALPLPEEDEIPTGKTDEDGDEVLDLYDDDDDLSDDIDYDLSKIEDEMLAEETEEEEVGMEVNEVIKMLRALKCKPCPGSDSKSECKIRKDHGCPPGKESKKKPWTEAERKGIVKRK